MSENNYTPQEALDLLLKKLKQRDESLARAVQTAIDAGKDEYVRDEDSWYKKKPHYYRKKAPYAAREALLEALSVLRACFIDLPATVNSTMTDFENTTIGEKSSVKDDVIISSQRKLPYLHFGEGREKEILIELRTETQISEGNDEAFPLKKVSLFVLAEQGKNFNELSELTRFSDS